MTTDELRAVGREQGLRLGICDAVSAPHYTAYMLWLRRGHHATMEYMAKQAELRRSPQQLLPGATSVIAVALDYNQPADHQPGYPKFARYALGRDYHRVLRAKLKRVREAVESAYPGSRSRICVDSAPIFERDYAHLAGLGWFGKNTCLIDSKRGSWFFLGLMLTTAPFEPDRPAHGGCGSCTRCVDACPTGAIVFEDARWQVDSRRCISYLTIEHRGGFTPSEAEAIGEWSFGCDVCQDVCPFNEQRVSQPLRAARTGEPGLSAAREWPSLASLAEVEPFRWDSLTRGSAVRRAGFAGLKRNVRANLENLAKRPRLLDNESNVEVDRQKIERRHLSGE